MDDYLAHRPSTPHLCDLAPQFAGPATAWDPGGGSPDVNRLAAVVRRSGSRHADVRLLVGGGERYGAAAAELADNLWCDVYVSPHDADLRYVRESSPVTGESWDAIAVDRATGEPADWLVVRPSDLPTGIPTWFVSARGRLRPRSGLVSLALPGGVSFATKATFRDASLLAGRMRVGAARVTTVAVNADLGKFEITRFDGTGSLLGGVEFATLVAASLDVVHPDVQLAFTWPTDAEACSALSRELMRLADALNRTVWVPQPAGAAFVLSGCGEFAAVDEVGSPTAWHAYPSRLHDDWKPHYGTDPDGRLVPLGDVAVTDFPGVPLVSVPNGQLRQLRPWYESVAPCDSLFAFDLAVLGDGRLGVCREDGTALAVGPRHLRALLRDAGWSGQDLLLLTQPPAQYFQAAVEHAGCLVDALKVDMWLPALGAEVEVRPDGTLGAQGPDGADLAWHALRYAPSEDLAGSDSDAASLPAFLAGPSPRDGRAAIHVAPVEPERVSAEAVRAPVEAVRAPVETQRAPVAGERVRVEPNAGAPVQSETLADEPLAPAAAQALEPVGVVPPRVRASKAGLPHAVPWLPTSPVVNARPIELYLWTSLSPENVDGWGLPSADVFLLACQDPLRLAGRQTSGYLLRVSVPAQAAVDMLEHSQHMPASVKQRLDETHSTHLLPVAWLSGIKVTARYSLDGVGGIARGPDVDDGALAVRFEGAEHGVRGLPNEVVHWPSKRQREDAPSYLMLPEESARTGAHGLIQSGYLPLQRRRPKVEDGHRLLEIRIRDRCVIDVPATLDRLNGLPVVGRLHDFVGLDLLLSEKKFASAYVTKIWTAAGNGRRPVVDKLDSKPLVDALALVA